MFGMHPFINRSDELAQLKRAMAKGGFGYLTGRRRVGKTALLLEACRRFGGLYHQAVEGTPAQQLLHLTEEIQERLPIFRDVSPKSWGEFFTLLSREKLPRLLVFDEFPYWVAGDSMLPSILQKWVDHELPKTKTLVLISGSSQAMLHAQFLKGEAPLYGRASFRMHLETMDYRWFCEALAYDPSDPASFARYALVGGVPHYWTFLGRGSLIKQATELYFEPSAMLAEEPIYLLRDEGVTGTLPKAMLDLIGRGVAKPSEIAARLGTVHGNLSRPLALLLDLGLVCRELPFGESLRTTKSVLYHIHDAALSFYYGTFLPNRSRWIDLSDKEKEARLHLHTSCQWEQFCREYYAGNRYWERQVEIDLVAHRKETGRYLVAECKWKTLSPSEEAHLLDDLRERYLKTRLSHRLGSNIEFRVLSKKDLGKINSSRA
jgi:AAA+ ATPase superfamily predicted ATPase